MTFDDREAAISAIATLRADMEVVASTSFAALTESEKLAVLDDLEIVARQLPAVGNQVINEIAANSVPASMGGTSLADVLATRLRISKQEAHRRIDVAQLCGPRHALTGEQLPPKLPNVSAAQARGQIGAEHLSVIEKFFKRLPDWVHYETREAAEHQLAGLAVGFGPTELRQAADRLAYLLNQDGAEPTDADRPRRGYLRLGKQGTDGMSEVHGLLDPEARATFDAVLATSAAPGMCNADDESPCVDGEPDAQTVASDLRTQSQRNHDALKAMGRSVLASGELGRHNGLPATIIVSTTLQELESAAGQAVTAGGSLLPMADLIRLASHAHHYLAVFDKHTKEALYLGRTKRLASAAQRIVLHARDRGCTRPGCTAPGYWCQAHHLDGWAAHHGPTDIDKLALACPPDNRLVEEGGWTTRKRKDGRIEWIPPPHLDTGQARTNNYHHPERYLVPDEDNDDDNDGDDGHAA